MSKSRVLIVVAALIATAIATDAADARRLGGGGRAGMQRSLPSQPAGPAATPAPGVTPPTAANPSVAPRAATPPVATAPAPVPRRSWLGPVAGLAAGLGLAALMSHLGLGAEFGSLLLIAAVVFGGLLLARAFVRRGASAATADGYGAMPPSQPAWSPTPSADAGTAAALPASSPAASARDDGFDAAGFAQVAQQIFVRLQAANDAGNLDELRAFTTASFYESVRDEIAACGGRAQRTDVVRIDAQVLDVATEDGQQVVSVRFHGLVREAADAAAEPFDEVWHLVRPLDGSRNWAIAGIQQTA